MHGLPSHHRRPIGVFDSGVGGLTVYKALREALPREDFIYLGDTARLPYGSKSAATVASYALQAARLLMTADIKLLVVACNTASALALPGLRAGMQDLPCLGVVEAGAEAAVQASLSGRIAVIATESTIRSGAYADAIRRLRSDAQVTSLACNLLVALAEEGWCDGAEAEAVLRRYLRELGDDFDTLVLGCTHFPLLAPLLQKLVGPSVRLVDSAAPVTVRVQDYLKQHDLLNDGAPGQSRFWVTDSPQRFGKIALRFLDKHPAPVIELANLSPNSHNDATDTIPLPLTAKTEP